MTRSDVSKGHPEYYRDVAERLAQEIPNSYFVNQFGNPVNARAHEETTAPEIWEQMGRRLDAVVCGVGTGGTLAGLTHYFARTAPQVEMVLADPVGSGLAGFAATGRLPQKMTPWLVEGIGGDSVPPVADFSRVSATYSIPDPEAFRPEAFGSGGDQAEQRPGAAAVPASEAARWAASTTSPWSEESRNALGIRGRTDDRRHLLPRQRDQSAHEARRRE